MEISKNVIRIYGELVRMQLLICITMNFHWHGDFVLNDVPTPSGNQFGIMFNFLEEFLFTILKNLNNGHIN